MMLRGNAAPFVPQAILSSSRNYQKGLSPSAQNFRPRATLNASAAVFIPRAQETIAEHLNDATRATASTTICAQTSNIHAEVFTPVLGLRKDDQSIQLFSSSVQIKPGPKEATLEHWPPYPTSGKHAESGTFVRRSPPIIFLPIPGSFAIEDGSKPSFQPATECYYDGSIELQRQNSRVTQNDERVIHCNWKGKLLYANGEEMTKRRGNTRAEKDASRYRHE